MVPSVWLESQGLFWELKLGINWKTRWWLLSRKGRKYVVSTGSKEAGWDLVGASSAGGAWGMLAGLRCAGGPSSVTAAGKQARKQAGSWEAGRSATGLCQLGLTGRAYKDKGDRTGACLL